MAHERQTLEAVIAARNQAQQAMAGGRVGQMAAAEAQLSGALGRLLGVVEAYPDLKGMATIGQLQEELTSTENRIAFARQLYNDTVTLYNTRQAQFPANLVAGMANASPAELWEIADDAERKVPQVDLGAAPRVSLAPKPSV
jgi:LemA protein